MSLSVGAEGVAGGGRCECERRRLQTVRHQSAHVQVGSANVMNANQCKEGTEAQTACKSTTPQQDHKNSQVHARTD